jgi:NAD(P) transhydrogenase subunit alpha
MRIAVPKELAHDERRVALTPDSVKRLVAAGHAVHVQRGAGAGAHHADADYQAAGARIEPDASATWHAGELVLRIRAVTAAEVALLAEGAAVVAPFQPLADLDRIRAVIDRRGTAIASDLIPRTTIAQAMDVLSSQASIAGYRAVLLAAEACPKLFPMMMTAAGTITPAKVLVLGAGVDGLQAIATARRLGAVVEAFDVRKAVKEQVESLGARFIEVPGEEDGAGAGGYAREVSAAYRAAQSQLIGRALARADVCITTAQIPGRAAPVLITAEQCAFMRPGAVIVDLAAEQGGNCALTRPGHRHLTDGGVFVIGDRNLPSQAPVHASFALSKNLERLVTHLAGAAADDPIATATRIVERGEPRHPDLVAALGADKKELAA